MNEKIESPFKWNLEKCIRRDSDLKWLESDEDILVKAVMHHVMASFILTTQQNFNEAWRYIKKTDELWKISDIRQIQSEGISAQMVHRIIQGTKYEFYSKTENFIGMEILKKKMMEESEFEEDHVSLSTLNGCKSIAWSILYESSGDESVSFARRAVFDHPQCSTWQFILGRSLRRLRRKDGLMVKPSSEELQSFSQAFERSKNPFFGIFFAQVMQENECTKEAQDLLEQVYQMNCSNLKARLHLALAFLRFHDLEKAKECLDYVERFAPESNMFLHYKGIYFMKQKQFEVASTFFKRASDNQNFGANLQYGLCMKEIDDDFSFIFHLLLMLRKFYNQREMKQQLLLSIGIEYYEERKFARSLKYIIEGIKVFPGSQSLLNFHHPSQPKKLLNVFELVEELLILNGFEENLTGPSPDAKHLLQELKNIRCFKSGLATGERRT